jgi:tRNA U34 2-thiouridine synthase MnmA/TrmU
MTLGKLNSNRATTAQPVDLVGKVKALALLSGGLDSRLAVRLLQQQGVEVEAVNYITPFCTCTPKSSCRLEAKKASEEYGIKLKVFYLFEEFLEIVKHPKYGRGSGLNPCLDCRILMFKKAKAYMKDVGAKFIVTGEVLGERPMSQTLEAIKKIEKESGLEGYIVRPLSAHLFRESVPERNGWVDRSQFAGISGRSRKPQIELAEKLNLREYPCPAGGCLLTDADFSNRLAKLLDYQSNPNRNDIMLLKVGRHFWFQEKGCVFGRLIVGRNESENFRLQALAREGDWLLESASSLGPTAIIRANHPRDEEVEKAAIAVARYSQGRHKDEVEVDVKRPNGGLVKTIVVKHPLEQFIQLSW